VKHTRIVIRHYGGPDALQVLEESAPRPQAAEHPFRSRAISSPRGCRPAVERDGSTGRHERDIRCEDVHVQGTRLTSQRG